MAERMAGTLYLHSNKALKNKQLIIKTGWPKDWSPPKKHSDMRENQNELPFEALTKGYILVPKHLLEILLDDIDRPMTELEAILTLLTKVNYKDTLCKFEKEDILCKRGEALYSIVHWAEMFHWRRSKARRFLKKMLEKKMIELLPIASKNTTHIRIVDYNLWTGSRQEAHKRKQEKEDERFEEFWEQYHYITGTRKINRGRAEREWHRMALPDQDLALKGINDYYYNLPDTRFCKQAAAYLADKAYSNE